MKSIRRHFLTLSALILAMQSNVFGAELQYRLIARNTTLQTNTGEVIPLSEGTLVILQEVVDDYNAVISAGDYRGTAQRLDLKYTKKYVYKSNLNLRDFPVTGDVLTTMPEGSAVSVISSEDGWSKVSFNGMIGYCSEEYLTSKHIIGSYRTPLMGNSANANNISVASNYINGSVVKAGQEFSYLNAIGGESTPEKGYQEAKVLKNGKASTGMGGGVCQVSSTLYAAIVTNPESKELVRIAERHSHSAEVAYIAKGLDATVWYPSLDLVIVPNVDIEIDSYVDGGYVYVEIVEL
ncbi:MAG: VanW family protein [Clostridia bacterium]|nr:VanW family protein [Clostridia bacterium]